MSNLQTVVDQILDARRAIPSQRSVLTAITGIDGCGKGYVTAQIVHALQAKGVRATGINIDGWLNLPHRRFNISNPAEHFYTHAIRFEEMFAQLIFPLHHRRSLRIEADYAEETATSYRRHTYAFEEIDVIVLEGIYGRLFGRKGTVSSMTP
jgi:uridine kinase